MIMGGTFPAARIILVQTDPFVVAFFRYVISALILSLIAWSLSRKPDAVKILSADKKKIIILGFVIVVLNQTLFLVGQKYTTAAHGGLLFALTPIFVYVMAMKHLGETWIIKKGLGVALAVGGSAVIIFENGFSFNYDILFGDAIIILAVIAWAGYTVYGKPLVEKYGAFRITAYTIIAGTFMYLPFGIYKYLTTDLSQITLEGWLGILYISILTSVVGYSLWYWLIKYMEATRAAVLVNIQPIIAGILGYYMLNEAISAHFIIGGLVILSGVYVTQKAK